MLMDAFNWFRLTRDSIRARDSSRRLAWGCAGGMAIGVVPNDSLLVYLLGILLLCSTANLLCAALSGFLFSWLAHFGDPLAHQLGELVLTSNQLEPCWLYLYKLPVIPWTRFNNTVVMGNLLVAALLLYPTYRISYQFFLAYGPTIRKRAERNRLYRWLAGSNEHPSLEAVR